MGVGAVTKQSAAYILASKRNRTPYVGVTSNLVTRVWEHKQNVVAGFTRTHHMHILVYVEQHEDMLRNRPAREAHQEVESCVENRVNREDQFSMAGLMDEHLPTAWIPQLTTALLIVPACFKRESRKSGAWVPFFEGMTPFLKPRHLPALPRGANCSLVMQLLSYGILDNAG